MPLGSLFSLQWFGPAAAAAVVQAGGAVQGAAVGTARATGAIAGIGSSTGRATRLAGQGATSPGAAVVTGSVRGRARAGGNIRVNTLGQDDVTGAVLDVAIEGDVTMREALRLLLAYAAGNATGLDSGPVAFRSIDGSKVRIGGTVSGGSRTVTTRDGG